MEKETYRYGKGREDFLMYLANTYTHTLIPKKKTNIERGLLLDLDGNPKFAVLIGGKLL